MLRARQFVEGGEGSANVTAASQWNPLFSVDEGVGGYVEVAGYDGFFAVRLRSIIPNSAQVPLPETYQRIGPAGSRTYFRVEADVGGTVEVRCLCPFNSTDHVDPETGIYTAAGTRAARVIARWLPERPETYSEQNVMFADTYGDVAAVATSSTSVRIYPTGYARDFAFRGIAPSGSLHIRNGYPGGLGVGNAIDAIVCTETLATSGSGSLDAWQALTIQNTSATTALVCGLSFRAPAGR
jgi:hypothetical protein